MQVSLWILALLCTAQAAERAQQLSLLQQVSPSSFNPLIYLKDEDDRVEVALSFSDALKYASNRAPNNEETDEMDSSQTQSELFMTGDTFDNRRTDRTKLQVQTVPGPGLTWADLDEVPVLETPNLASFSLADQDIYTDLTRAYRFSPGDLAPVAQDTDEVLVETANRQELTLVRLLGTVNRVQGDRYEYTDREGVPVLYSLDPYTDLRGDLVDNGLSDSVPLTLRAERPAISTSTTSPRDPEVIQRTIPTSNITLSSATISAEHILGERRVADDREQVPVYDSSGQDAEMTGDPFNNQRTDKETLVIVTRSPEERGASRAIPSLPPPVTVERVDLDDIGAVDLTLISPFHDHGEQAILTPAIPYYADRPSDIMVGDLFNNKRTDRSKLTIARLTPQVLVSTLVPSPPIHSITAAPIHIESWDLDEVEAPVREESEQPVIKAVLSRYDSDDYVQPEKKDLDEASGPFTFSFYSDIDESTPTELIVPDQDDLWTYSFSLSDSSPLSRLFSSKSFNKEMGIATNSKGDRKAFSDLNEVPTYYSGDRKDSLGGDMFDNHRSDVTKLRVVLEQGTSLRWRDERSSNPGFLQ